MGKRSSPLGVIRTSLRLCAISLVFLFSLAGPAGARNCTSAEKSAADAQLWLNKRDKAAALALHMPWGVPDSSGAERILIQRDYVIGYSDSLLIPLWTAHRLDASGLGNVTRVDCFRRDPRIPAPVASLPSDFDESIFDQGHLTPNGDMSKRLIPVINSFILSNMGPQHCQFNRGLWQILESLVRIWAQEQGPLYVMSGSILDQNADGVRDDDSIAPRMSSRNGKSRVAVPTPFYKILIRRLADGAMDVLAVVMPNDMTNLDGDDAIRYIENHLISVDDIEKLTGLTLLPAMRRPLPERATALWPYGKSAARSLAHNCTP